MSRIYIKRHSVAANQKSGERNRPITVVTKWRRVLASSVTIEGTAHDVYLRTANALCIQKSGVSIFDLGDARWRDAYDEQRQPQEMVDEVLAEEGFPSGED